MTIRKAIITGLFVATVATSAWATPVAGTYYNQNDCAGTFGKDFDACKAPANDSPIIAKADITRDGNGAITGYSWTINSLFPSITGAEWNISFTAGTDGRQGSFVYTPGTNDPLITYFVAKFGNDFILYGPVGGLAGGQQTGSWNSADAGSTVQCNPGGNNCRTVLNMGGGLSHLSFYDTKIPVPEPTALALMGLGLVGVGVARRRKAS